MPRFNSRAEELRHHRKCFELGLELGCTPKEAEEWMDAVQKREELRAFCKKRGIAWNPPAIPMPGHRHNSFEQFDAGWMMRN